MNIERVKCLNKQGTEQLSSQKEERKAFRVIIHYITALFFPEFWNKALSSILSFVLEG